MADAQQSLLDYHAPDAKATDIASREYAKQARLCADDGVDHSRLSGEARRPGSERPGTPPRSGADRNNQVKRLDIEMGRTPDQTGALSGGQTAGELRLQGHS